MFVVDWLYEILASIVVVYAKESKTLLLGLDNASVCVERRALSQFTDGVLFGMLDFCVFFF